jgi:glyoxylate/hydroxypyruvate reductase A
VPPAGARPRILVYDAHEAARYAALIRAPRSRVEVRTAATPAEASSLVADADILYAWNFPPELYARAGKLAWIQIMGAGVDAALVPELPPGVTITRAPGVFGPWMVEYVLGWCLWITQRMAEYRAAQQARRWTRILPERLAGKTMALVGLGDIGRTVARAARALGMRVIGVSRSGRRVAGVDAVYRPSTLTRALGQADFVVLVVPLTPETRGLVGARELGSMRASAWLVNVARGPVVDEAALVAALERRQIAGAVLDVFATEPLPAANPLWALDNVVITPHISGPSTPDDLAPVFNENLARFLARRPLRHVVHGSRGY